VTKKKKKSKSRTKGASGRTKKERGKKKGKQKLRMAGLFPKNLAKKKKSSESGKGRVNDRARG